MPDEPGDEGAAASGTPLKVLLRVQDLDTAISRLHHRRATLAERGELETIEAELAGLAARGRELQSQRQSLVDRQAELEEQIGGLTARRKSIEDRLYAARGSASRDLQAMDDEIHHLTQRRAEIEEVELEVMEEQEPIDAELARLGEERARLEAAAGSLRQTVAEAEAVVDAEIAAEAATRAQTARDLPTDLSDRYEVLRARLSGIGAARLIGNHCDGCHLEMSSVEVERIRHLPAGTVASCDQCGRILVRA